jgi:membrane protease YdiL (CAAX protease family)
VAAGATRRARGPVRWRWGHLWLFGLCAWGRPAMLTATLALDRSWTWMLDAGLAFQILGYVLAALVAVVLVQRVQKGDWTTLGVRGSEATVDEIVKGAAFGAALIVIYLPIGFALSGGSMSTEGLVNALLGDTSQVGLLLAGIVLVVGAPVIEEIYYRGMLYEKLARRGPGLAIVGSSLLFVMAHGALIIPALLLLAFGLGIKRQTRSIWFTMAAHATWNLVVLCLASYLIFRPDALFSPPDGAYTLEHPRKWQRSEELETRMQGASVDLALNAPSGAFVGLVRFDVPVGTPSDSLKSVLRQVGTSTPGAVMTRPPRRSKVVLDGFPSIYEITTRMKTPDGPPVKSRVLAVLPRGETEAYVFNFACPKQSCRQTGKDFEQMLDSLRFES